MSEPSGSGASLARGTGINLVSRTGAVGLGLLITLVVARLGTEAQGLFALFTAVEAVVLAACSGLGVALARRISHHRQAAAPLVSAMVWACLGLGCALGLLCWSASRWLGESYRALVVLASVLPLALVAPNLTGLWLGQGRMAPIAAITLAAPSLTLAGLAGVWLVGGPISAMTVLLCWAASRVLVSLGGLLAAFQGGWAAPNWPALRADLGFALTVGAANLISMLNYKVDLFLVEHYLGVASTGVYSIAVMVAELLWFVSASASQAAFARVGTPDRAHSGATVVRVLHVSVLALLLCAPLLYAAAHWALPPLLGEAYRAALPVLALLLPGVLAYSAASALSAYFTNHAGKPLVPAAMAGLSLLINLVLSVLLIPRLGMAGGAVATSVSYILTIMLMLHLFRTHAGLSWRTLLWPDGASLRQDLAAVRRIFRHEGARP